MQASLEIGGEQTLTGKELTLLVEDSKIESQKIIGVFKELGIPFSTESAPKGSQLLQGTHYGDPPVLLYREEKVELFWNIVLVLDELYWKSTLTLSDPKHSEKLFSLFETLDYQVFPLLDCSDENSTPQPKMQFAFSKLLQWVLLPRKKKEEERGRARRENLSPGKDLSDAIEQLELVLKDSRTLPELHRRVLTGALKEVLIVASKENSAIEEKLGAISLVF